MSRRPSTGRSASTGIGAPARVRTGSGSGRCGATDSEVPVATREIQRPKNQEEGCPSVDAVREAYDARGGRGTATGNAPDPKDAEVAVLIWHDQALHAGSRGRCPPPAQAFCSGVVVGCVHRDASCGLWCRPPDHLSISYHFGTWFVHGGSPNG